MQTHRRTLMPYPVLYREVFYYRVGLEGTLTHHTLHPHSLSGYLLRPVRCPLGSVLQGCLFPVPGALSSSPCRILFLSLL